MIENPEVLNFSSEEREQLLQAFCSLMKEKVSLQQSWREEQTKALSASEELYIELLEAMDALEFMINYMDEHPDISPEFIKRLPKSLKAVYKKFGSVLEKRQVQQLELSTTQVDFNICRVVESEVRPELEDKTVTKVIRKGFSFGDKILRPIEVITSKKE
ncbi:MAG: nucleotide exchange factor GrpE [Crinalium sp.]|uniref:GrpE protein n=1 Tax=Crinalium epipsammum PCC 9333 TaxID=1173022 RepID=K9W5U5_9CYAN|nr:nucleotide exchange factor GrpE [Crinalium epipsammum]AFZ15169.1 hypothetical protein Cri9333_4386 [Crinalium epipsammum PCC 9333]